MRIIKRSVALLLAVSLLLAGCDWSRTPDIIALRGQPQPGELFPAQSAQLLPAGEGWQITADVSTNGRSVLASEGRMEVFRHTDTAPVWSAPARATQNGRRLLRISLTVGYDTGLDNADMRELSWRFTPSIITYTNGLVTIR